MVQKATIILVSAIVSIVAVHAQASKPMATGADVSWIAGQSDPLQGVSINPGTPFNIDIIHFTCGTGQVYDNSCLGEQAQGGSPSITVDPATKNIHVRFDPPAPEACSSVSEPVCGLEGSFGPLERGEWTFWFHYRVGPGGHVNLVSFYVGTVHFVDGDAPGSNDGSSWANAYTNLQEALAAASSGDEIRVGQGTYRPHEGVLYAPELEREQTFQLVNGVTVKGGYAGFGEPDPNARNVDEYETIVSGDLDGNDGPDFANNGENSYHVVTSSGTDGTTVLDGFTITGGNANGSDSNTNGGGINGSGTLATIKNCTITGNSSGRRAAGLFDCDGSIINCTVSGNNCTGDAITEGAGLHSCDGPIIDCLISNNTSGSSFGLGGGFYNCHGDIINCTIINNTAVGKGGGLYNCDGDITNCTITGNTAEHDRFQSRGGGLYRCDGTISNCIISDNHAKESGGGLFDCRGSISNCLISSNTADDYWGGGLCCCDGTIRNCIIVGNSAGGNGGGIYDAGLVSNCIISNNLADGNGGGISNAHSIHNCTISGNISGGYGGGIYLRAITSGITNCILWDDMAANSNEMYLDYEEIPGFIGSIKMPSTATFRYNDIKGGATGIGVATDCILNWGMGNIDVDPLFVDAEGLDNVVGTEDDDLRLLPRSPCINAGDNSAVPPSVIADIDGNPRIVSGVVDMGAYEFQGCATCLGDLTDDGWLCPIDLSALISKLIPYSSSYYWRTMNLDPCGDMTGDGWLSPADVYDLVSQLLSHASSYYWVQCPQEPGMT